MPSVGGTKNPRVSKTSWPWRRTLVLANQEENTRGDLEALAQRGARVYVALPASRVADGLGHLAKLARILGAERDAPVRELLKRGYDAYRRAEERRARSIPTKVFCPIWMDPLMTIHGETFISDMLDLCGAHNVFADRPRRYPLAADLGRAKPLSPEQVAGRDTRYSRVTMDEVVARVPELVLLPDEPHPFSEADAAVFRALRDPGRSPRCRGTRCAVHLRIGGKDLCWYGARSIDALDRLAGLIANARRTAP